MEFEREIIFISTIAYKSIYAQKNHSKYEKFMLEKTCDDEDSALIVAIQLDNFFLSINN